MGKNKKKKKHNKQKKFHYDIDSFFVDDVLKEIKDRREEKKKTGLTY